MVIGTPSNWSKSNSELLAQFLSSGTGQLFLAHVAAMRPSLLGDSADVNAVALRGQLVAGYERATNNIISLTEPPIEADRQKQTETYPSLDDDSAWEKPTDNTPEPPANP